MRVMVEAEGVYASYRGFTALRGVTLRIPWGLTLLMGPNGSGKTTLLRLLAGILRPSRGRITIAGLEPYRDLSRIIEMVTYIPEKDPYPGDVRVIDVVEALSLVHGEEPVSRALKLLELEEHVEKNLAELSQGLRRRTILLEALSSPKPVILLDEPFRGLDSHSRRLVSRAINSLKGEKGIIVSSHIIGELQADYLVILEDGMVSYSGSPKESLRGCTTLSCPQPRISCNPEEIEELIRKGCKLVEIQC